MRSRDGDRVACTYRGHGHLLARGLEPEALLGRAPRPRHGRQRRPCRLDEHGRPDHGLIGCFGIVGGSIAAATGAALALQGQRATSRIAFFGDGATNQAYFFECLNFAKVLNLPAVFVCENNGYGEYTPTEAVTAGTIVARAEAMEVPAIDVDGMDVWTTREAALEAVERVRSGAGPGVHRGAHVPVRRALAQRPGQVPAARGARAAGSSATRSLVAEQRLAEEHGVSADRAPRDRRGRRARARARSSRPRSRRRSPRRSVFSEFKE